MLYHRIFVILFLCYFSLNECTTTCLKDGIVWQNSCLYYNTTEIGFVVAELYCQQMGGHLVSIHDAFTNAFIAEKAGQKFQNWLSFWIGGNTLIGGDSNWSWTDGSPFNYADWTTGEPGSPSNKQCILASVNQGYWSTESCSRTRPFICSISTATQPPTTTTTLPPMTSTTTKMPTAQKNCTFGWVYFEPTNSCYGYNNRGIMMNWTSAETYCNSQGAHLASIHSYEEQMFINEFGLVSWKSVWLGLYSYDLGQTWKWTDGSNFDYVSWYRNQNPSVNNGLNCVILESSTTTSGFATTSCSSNWLTICKKPYFGS